MKKIIVILLISGLFASYSYSQVTGYLGKKITANYNFQFFNAFVKPNINQQKGLRSFNSSNTFSADYILLGNMSAGLSFSSFKTRLMYDKELYFDANLIDQYGAQWKTNVSFKSDTSSILNYSALGLYVKIYHTTKIAPIGIYSKIGINKGSYSLEYDYTAILQMTPSYYTDSRLMNLPFPSPDEKYKRYSLSYGLYYSTVMYGRMILNFGCSTEIPITNLIKDYITWNNDDITKFNYLTYYSDMRLFNHQILNFDFGIGVLIY